MNKNKKPKMKKNDLKTAKRLMKYVTEKYKFQFILVFFCILISAVATTAVSLSLRYLLDDSTSAVDTKTDALIRKAFREEIPDTTKIIIAQRVSSIEDADQIIVLDDGKIAGIGTHKELLKSCDAYYQIASSQLSEAELARDLNNENDGKEEA